MVAIGVMVLRRTEPNRPPVPHAAGVDRRPARAAGCVLLFFSLGWNPTISSSASGPWSDWWCTSCTRAAAATWRRAAEHLLHAHARSAAAGTAVARGPDAGPDRRLRPTEKPGSGRVFFITEPCSRDSLNCRHACDIPSDQNHLRHLAGEIITNVRELSLAGWTPDQQQFLAPAGRSPRRDHRVRARQGRLTEADIMVVDFDGNAVAANTGPQPKPAAQLYASASRRRLRAARIRAQTVARACTPRRPCHLGLQVRAEGLSGTTTHEAVLDIQCCLIRRTCARSFAAGSMPSTGSRCGLPDRRPRPLRLGPDTEARRHLEPSFLLGCELEDGTLK